MTYCTCPGWLWWWRIWWNEDWQGKPKYSEKTCPSAILSTTNPTWRGLGLNPGRRGGKPATNRLSYGAVVHVSITTFPSSPGSVFSSFYRKTFSVILLSVNICVQSFSFCPFFNFCVSQIFTQRNCVYRPIYSQKVIIFFRTAVEITSKVVKAIMLCRS
jgi:hypothetical protein